MAGNVKLYPQVAIGKVFMKIINKPLNALTIGQPIQRTQEKQARKLCFTKIWLILSKVNTYRKYFYRDAGTV
jgi:hypothetical protein